MKDRTKIVLWSIAALVAVVVISIGVWAFRVATSDIAGQGNATIQKNSANNRIAAQERFEQLYQDIQAADARIVVAKATLDTKPKDRTLLTNYTGSVNFCLQLVADYNANSRKFTQEDFRSIDLPYQIDTLSPSTDCKE
jgi:hypothetical protein